MLENNRMLRSSSCFLSVVYAAALLLKFSGCADSRTQISGEKVHFSDELNRWALFNLDVQHFANGDAIPHVPDSASWVANESPAWVYYMNDTSMSHNYGRLYNWYAIADPRGLCPEGWHVATDEDWERLVQAFGGAMTAGARLKADNGWELPIDIAAPVSGFNALPSGNRKPNGIFNGLGLSAPFWTSTPADSGEAWARYVFHAHTRVGRRSGHPNHALPCRCVKDNP